MTLRNIAHKLGANYAWGVINYTAGVISGGVFVALALIAANTFAVLH
jgi:hypothetical protein